MEEYMNILENGQVPVLSIVFMAVSLVFAFAIPIAGFVFLRKKYNCKMKAFFWGMIVWIVLASLVESIVHSLILTSSIGATIQGNIWLYATYGAFMAALFEETGRYLAINFRMKDCYGNNKNALMYGMGHGGVEAMYIIGLGMVSNISCAVMINNGMVSQTFESVLASADPETTFESLSSLVTSSSWIFLVGILERLFAMAAHIGMTIPVWYAAKEKKFGLYFVAFGMHFAMDFISVISNNYISNVLLVELIIAVIAVLICVGAFYMNKKHENMTEDALS